MLNSDAAHYFEQCTSTNQKPQCTILPRDGVSVNLDSGIAGVTLKPFGWSILNPKCSNIV